MKKSLEREARAALKTADRLLKKKPGGELERAAADMRRTAIKILAALKKRK